MWQIFKKVMYESLTSRAGEYDPARVFGYLFVLMSANVFLVLFIWHTFKTGKFEATEFATGVAGISTTLLSAAAGVALKSSSEKSEPKADAPK